MSKSKAEKRREEDAEDRKTLERRAAQHKAIQEKEIENDAPFLDLTYDADRKGERLVPLDKLFKR